MKKINYLLILITLICSFVTIFSELDKGIVIILKDASIIFTISVPYIVKRVFKIDLSESFITLWIIYIFFNHYLGIIAEYYNKWEGLDKWTHMLSGVLSAYGAALILKYNKTKNTLVNILFIVSFAWLCAGLWETFEFTCNYFVGGDAQRVAETGVSDTMWDMIVAFIGAILFSIYYYITSKILHKNS